MLKCKTWKFHYFWLLQMGNWKQNEDGIRRLERSLAKWRFSMSKWQRLYLAGPKMALQKVRAVFQAKCKFYFHTQYLKYWRSIFEILKINIEHFQIQYFWMPLKRRILVQEICESFLVSNINDWFKMRHILQILNIMRYRRSKYYTVWSSDLYTLLMRYEVNLTP